MAELGARAAAPAGCSGRRRCRPCARALGRRLRELLGARSSHPHAPRLTTSPPPPTRPPAAAKAQGRAVGNFDWNEQINLILLLLAGCNWYKATKGRPRKSWRSQTDERSPVVQREWQRGGGSPAVQLDRITSWLQHATGIPLTENAVGVQLNRLAGRLVFIEQRENSPFVLQWVSGRGAWLWGAERDAALRDQGQRPQKQMRVTDWFGKQPGASKAGAC